MQVKSIAECSKGSILQYFRPSLSYHLSLRSLFCLFLSGCFTQVLLYIIYTLKFLPLLKIGRDQLEPWWVSMPFFYYFIIACGLILNVRVFSKLHARHLTCVLILNVRVYLATFSVNSMPGIWAVICDFQQCGVLTSVDSDHPSQPPFKLKNSK